MSYIQKLMDFIPDKQTCAVVISPVNRRYFTGCKTSSGVLVCFKEKSFFLVDFRYFEKASEIVKDCEVILEKDRTVQLGELFKSYGVSKAMIEAEYMTVNQLNSFRNTFSSLKIDFSSSLSNAIGEMRVVKDGTETEKMESAQKIADKTFEYVKKNIKKGMTEKEIALMIDNQMKMLGAENVSFDTIALVGKNTSLPHGVPGNDTVCDNCFILMDFGAVVDGYCSDMTRTIYYGIPSDEEKKAYEVVLQAQLKALESVRAGIVCKSLDAVAREYIDSTEFKDAFGHSLGHGVGMDIHEKPFVSRKNDKTILKSGMVITVEPGIYIPGKFGIRIEDMVVVTENGCKNFTGSSKELITIGN